TAVREQLEKRPDYESRLALAFYATGNAEAGDRALRRSIELAGRSDTDEAVNSRLDVARVLMDRGDRDRAVSIYQQAVNARPAIGAAWEGLIGAYAQMKDFNRALAAL